MAAVCRAVQCAVVQSIRFDSLKKKIKELQKILSSVLFDTFHFFFSVSYVYFRFQILCFSISFHSISFLLFPSSYHPLIIFILLHEILPSFPFGFFHSFHFIWSLLSHNIWYSPLLISITTLTSFIDSPPPPPTPTPASWPQSSNIVQYVICPIVHLILYLFSFHLSSHIISSLLLSYSLLFYPTLSPFLSFLFLSPALPCIAALPSPGLPLNHIDLSSLLFNRIEPSKLSRVLAASLSTRSSSVRGDSSQRLEFLSNWRIQWVTSIPVWCVVRTQGTYIFMSTVSQQLCRLILMLIKQSNES